jgi:lipoic acid synthetase
MTIEKPKKVVPGEKLRGYDKVSRIPVKIIPTEEIPRKPDWLRIKMSPSTKVAEVKERLRKHKLASVCEEANCPNLSECFSGGTATFMIMGEICTRRCPFCDVAHGRPLALDPNEPVELAEAIQDMGLKYVVITSVDRDDLRDGGAQHFADCIRETRARTPGIRVEVLVPDFRGRMDIALDILSAEPPDVFNHNLESVPRLYKEMRPGSDYQWSLDLLKKYKERNPEVLTKTGLMLGMGETRDELIKVFEDMRAHDIDMLTLGQYLMPSKNHYPMDRYVHPDASGPLVRSSYHADKQVDLSKLKALKN